MARAKKRANARAHGGRSSPPGRREGEKEGRKRGPRSMRFIYFLPLSFFSPLSPFSARGDSKRARARAHVRPVCGSSSKSESAKSQRLSCSFTLIRIDRLLFHPLSFLSGRAGLHIGRPIFVRAAVKQRRKMPAIKTDRL